MNVYIKNNANKRDRICRLHYIYVSGIAYENYPGDSLKLISGEFSEIRFSSASFSETESVNGESYSQELTINLKGSDPGVEKTIQDIIGNYCLFRLDYASGVSKLVGSKESPVMLTMERTGVPEQYNLSSTRQSAEKAKIMLS